MEINRKKTTLHTIPYRVYFTDRRRGVKTKFRDKFEAKSAIPATFFSRN